MEDVLYHEDWCAYINEMYKLHLDLGNNDSDYYYTLNTGDYLELVDSNWFLTYASNEFGKEKNMYCGHRIWLKDDLKKGVIKISRDAIVNKKYKLTLHIDARSLKLVKKFIESVKDSVYEGVNVWDGEELENI